MDILADHGLIQIIDKPTRQENVLDFSAVNNHYNPTLINRGYFRDYRPRCLLLRLILSLKREDRQSVKSQFTTQNGRKLKENFAVKSCNFVFFLFLDAQKQLYLNVINNVVKKNNLQSPSS